MNHILQHYKQARLKQLLSSIECLLRIVQVKELSVRSNESVIRISELQAEHIRFVSRLKLPLSMVTYSLALHLDTEVLEIKGQLTECKKVCNEEWNYRMQCRLSPDDRVRLYQWVNGRMGEEMVRWFGPYAFLTKKIRHPLDFPRRQSYNVH